MRIIMMSLFSFFLWIYLFLNFFNQIDSTTDQIQSSSTKSKLPIIYVYSVVEYKCRHGLPHYIRISLEQAIMTQPDCEVVLMSNFGQCLQLYTQVSTIQNLTLIDILEIKSQRTLQYEQTIAQLFVGRDSLWLTSAIRFFNLEDLMIKYSYTSLIHVEADTMIYGSYTSLLPTLQEYYPMAATPLNTPLQFITAAVFWVKNLTILHSFNDYLFNVSTENHPVFLQYIDWLREISLNKGDAYKNEVGVGIQPFSMNEMSMLAYYHHINPHILRLLPITPTADYFLNRYVCNMSNYSPHGQLVGHSTGSGIWDPSSWGQFVGGTFKKRGKDLYFTEKTHISGQAIRMGGCNITMTCSNRVSDGLKPAMNRWNQCYTMPLIHCERSKLLTPLWNLHIHSKHTYLFQSKICDC